MRSNMLSIMSSMPGTQSEPCSAKHIVRFGWFSNTPPQTMKPSGRCEKNGLSIANSALAPGRSP